jgi:hypothetical protein
MSIFNETIILFIAKNSNLQTVGRLSQCCKLYYKILIKGNSKCLNILWMKICFTNDWSFKIIFTNIFYDQFLKDHLEILQLIEFENWVPYQKYKLAFLYCYFKSIKSITKYEPYYKKIIDKKEKLIPLNNKFEKTYNIESPNLLYSNILSKNLKFKNDEIFNPVYNIQSQNIPDSIFKSQTCGDYISFGKVDSIKYIYIVDPKNDVQLDRKSIVNINNTLYNIELNSKCFTFIINNYESNYSRIKYSKDILLKFFNIILKGNNVTLRILINNEEFYINNEFGTFEPKIIKIQSHQKLISIRKFSIPINNISEFFQCETYQIIRKNFPNFQFGELLSNDLFSTKIINDLNIYKERLEFITKTDFFKNKKLKQ